MTDDEVATARRLLGMPTDAPRLDVLSTLGTLNDLVEAGRPTITHPGDLT